MDRYPVLSPDEVIAYVRTTLPDFAVGEQIIATRLTGNTQSVDSRVNMITILRAEPSGQSLVCKQLMPYVQLSNKSHIYELNINRFFSEIHSLKVWDHLIPDSVPKIYFCDETRYIILMEDLSRLNILSVELLKGKQFSDLPWKLGDFLGRTAFYTSTYFLTREERYKLKQLFSFCDTKCAWDHFIFTGSILKASHPGINPYIRETLEFFCQNPRIRQETHRLRELYLEKQHCLIHSDLHTSNILVSQQELKIFDAEYATFGPISFDIGRLLCSFMLTYAALPYRNHAQEEINKQQTYLLQLISETYQAFEAAFEKAWQQHLASHINYDSHYNQFSRKSTLQETLGFAACAAISRIYDGGLTFDFKDIADLKLRAQGLDYVIRLAQELLLTNAKITSISEVIAMMQKLQSPKT